MAKKKGPYRPYMAESTSFETREIFKDLFSVYIEIYNVELLKILMDYKKI